MTTAEAIERAVSALEALATAGTTMAGAAERVAQVLEAWQKPLTITTPHPSWVKPDPETFGREFGKPMAGQPVQVVREPPPYDPYTHTDERFT